MSLNDKNLDRLINEALAIEAEEAREAGALGFMARILVQATMPHKKTEKAVFQRQNGDFNLSITSHPKIGLPYGTIPRLLLAWLTTEAVRTGERELILGESMSEFMRQLGLVPTGGRWGSIIRLKEQTKRLFMANVQCFVDNSEQFSGKNLRVADGYHLWWEPISLDQKALWQSTVLLDQAFFEEVIDRPVPIDMRALQAIKQSPMALDIYAWLTYRMSYLKHHTEIPWEALQMQFGADYAHDGQGKRDFKKNFLKHLKKVHVVYPDANVSEGGYGLVLKPSKTHVKRIK
ncbi:MAG: replication protein RepA [Candidatus Sedimenticola sp. (ex Thyasira tokunagai)]